MTLDRKLVKEACLELYNAYHDKIEDLGYSLGKGSTMQSIKEISIVASISPNYSEEMSKTFRKIIPMEFMYKREKISVIISPSIGDIFGF
jgi:hypothetical protein